jgi:hypothetical protein
MGMDNYYIERKGRWVRMGADVAELFATDFWVDVKHGGNYAIDERYYLPNPRSALKFIEHGWKARQFVYEGKPCGLFFELHSPDGCFMSGQLSEEAEGAQGNRICTAEEEAR